MTLGLGSAEAMAAAALAHPTMSILKLKLGAEGDLDRVRAVRAAAPDRRLIVDANEGWTRDQLGALAPALAELGVELIEQPLPAGEDRDLAAIESPITICADESCTDRRSLPPLVGRYGMINIKLEKCGGLTEALKLAEAAKEHGLRVMVGCRVATSLNMAPAWLVAQSATFVDLDGPLWLREDRAFGLQFDKGWVSGDDRRLWG
jgi:L-alanine-DL-glutamate epimerase-like enolase superfamily enzyme